MKLILVRDVQIKVIFVVEMGNPFFHPDLGVTAWFLTHKTPVADALMVIFIVRTEYKIYKSIENWGCLV